MDLLFIPPPEVLTAQQIPAPEGWPAVKAKTDDQLDMEGAPAIMDIPSASASSSAGAAGGAAGAAPAEPPGDPATESDVESAAATESD